MDDWDVADIPDLSGKVAVLAGAADAVGLETAHRLVANGARVVIACRDLGTAECARRRVLAATEVADDRIEAWALDPADRLSVDVFVGRLLRSRDRLDVLINHTGARSGGPGLPSGRQPPSAAREIGYVALTLDLLPLLVATPGARVVTAVAAGPRPVGRRAAPCGVLFAAELARRLRAGGHRTLSLAVARRDRRCRPRAAARAVLRAATDPHAVSGRLYAPAGFRGRRVACRPGLRAGDGPAATRLWARCLRLLAQEEPPQLVPAALP
jgi:protochlorophyllide reductase